VGWYFCGEKVKDGAVKIEAIFASNVELLEAFAELPHAATGTLYYLGYIKSTHTVFFLLLTSSL
jgi:hypothetical protein